MGDSGSDLTTDREISISALDDSDWVNKIPSHMTQRLRSRVFLINIISGFI